MRITQATLARLGIEQLNGQRNRLARTQEQAATGLRVNRPSDDPVDYRTILFLKDASDQTERFLRSIDLARVRTSTTESALDGAAEAISRARVQGLAASSTTNQSQEARDALKTEVEQLFEEIVNHANTRAPGGGYVFSGYAGDTPTFTVSGDFASGTPPVATFTGHPSTIEVEIDETVYVEVTRNGQEVFQGANDVFVELGRLWDGIDQNDQSLIDAAIDGLDEAFNHVQLERSRLGGADAKIDTFENRLRLQQETLTSQVSFLEDADAFEVYSNLTIQEASLQAALEINARLLGPTLLDFI